MIGYYPINPQGSGVEEDAFGPRFFRTHFFDHMRQACQVNDHTPVLELHLTSGQVLDVSHIIELNEDYMLLSAFVDTRDCTNTYNAYIRYITIFRINLQTPSSGERAIGFTPREPAGMKAAVKAKPNPKPTRKKK